jgi:hypothetical protein
MRRIFYFILAASIGCSGSADEERRKAEEAKAREAKQAEETRLAKLAEEQKGKEKTTRAQVETLTQISKLFYFDYGRFPQSLDELLLTPQPGDKGGAYCKAADLLDSWGQKLLYNTEGPKTMIAGGEGPDIWSMGNPSAPKEIGNWMR